ncbi:hydrogenase maturation protease [Chloroflexota bacterium]
MFVKSGTEQMVRARPIKIVVLGMGNLLLRDEGIGIHVIDAMKETRSPDNVELELVDGGTLPDAPLSFEEVDKLIIVDAVQADGEPGAIYRFHPEDINLDNKALTSLHQISLLENLWLMEQFGQKPKDIVIIGIEPQDMSWGLELSTRLEKRVPQIIRVVLEEISSKHPGKPEKGE